MFFLIDVLKSSVRLRRMTPEADSVSLDKIAKLYDFHPETIRRMARRGQLPGAFKANGRWRCRLEAIKKKWKEKIGAP